MTLPAAPRPLLLVLAHGVGAPELVHLRGRDDGPAPVALRLPAQPVAAALGELDAARELTDLGVAVDRSGLVLRPAGRSDATAAERLAGRPTGPADVTLFEARDVLAQAMVGGAPATVAATARLGDLLRRLATILRHGDAPELWLVGLGSPRAVRTTFDLAAAWRRHVLPPLDDELDLRAGPATATVRGANQRALDRVARLLREAPFAAHGRLAPCATGTLRFDARPGVAFGPAPLAARPALPHEANGVVVAPLGDLAHAPDLAFADVMARFWLRAAARHADLAEGRTPTPAAAARVPGDAVTPATAPDPLPQPAPKS